MAKTNFIFFMTQTNNVPFRAASHNHTCYELVYYLSGRGILIINSKEIPQFNLDISTLAVFNNLPS